VDNPLWTKLWDSCIFIGSFLPALLFGVAFANIFQGIPFDAEGLYHGNLFTLLNPYGLLGGVLFVLLFVVHGALWIAIRAEGDLHDRAASIAGKLWIALLVVSVIFLAATYFSTTLYDNYLEYPVLFIVVVLAVGALLGTRLFIAQQAYFKAWFSSSLTIVSCTFFGIIGLFPNLFPSSISEEYSLTAFNASSSPLTLKIMLIVVILFIPVVLAYQIWAYSLFTGKIAEEDLEY
jgi:cytochrome d ubiquinol oxidase subunit II